ncbi:MAG: DUF11 domain-containing protein [Planctomycetes bacterium]|nr:DUF11 domain-containing protein [Planctomycetota bacterium]
MRRGTWILAVSGVMALNTGVSFAADPAQGIAPTNGKLQIRNRQAAVPTAGLPSRYTRGTTAAEKTKQNYYEELFGEPAKPQAAEPKASVAATDTSWADDVPAAETAAAPAKVAAKLPMEHARPAADARKFAPAVRNSKTAAEPSDKVIQAGYDKLPTSSERRMIQQVRSEGPKRPTAPPMPELGGSSDAPVGKVGIVGPLSTKATVAEAGPQTPQVTIEWVKKGDINVGQECQLELIVKNSGSVPASEVAVDGLFPSTVRLTSATPKPAASGEKVTWSFDSLAPGSEQKISVKLIPSRRGDLGATAQVRFTGAASASFRVEEPLLKVALKGPTEVMLGDPASQMILVSNPGTGTVHDVKVEARISDGLEHGSRGERLIMEVGSIGPGESRTVRLGLSAIKGGQQSISVAANSSSDAGATTAVNLNVIAPSLKIAVDGPALRYKGRNAKYNLTVTNDGSVPNNNIRISQTVADGFKFVAADHNGKYDSGSKSVQWFVGRLEPGQTATVACELSAVALGDFSHTVAVLSDSGIRAEAKAETRVDGIASLTMELVDLDDPVEIGAETAYEIRVKNEGSKAASAVSIACELPPEMELKSVKAPVEFVNEGRQILFKSLDNVAPGATVVYKVHVKGIQEGNHRMRVRMTGASLQEPVVREEATKVYADTK